MDLLMESGFMHWMSERISFTNWVKADFHETSRITLKFSASPREISARRGEFALRQLLFLGSIAASSLRSPKCGRQPSATTPYTPPPFLSSTIKWPKNPHPFGGIHSIPR